MAWNALTIALMAPLALVGLILIPVILFAGNLFGGMLYRFFIGEYYNNPVKDIPKVKHTDGLLKTLIMGDFARIKAARPAAQHIEWMQDLGPVYRYRHAFYVQRVLLADPKAMLWLTTQQNSYKFPKPEHTAAFLAAMLGHGIISADGDVHKRQRRILSPAFSPASIRDLQPNMDRHGVRLVNKLNDVFAQIHARIPSDLKALNAHSTLVGAPGELADGETPQDRLFSARLGQLGRPNSVVMDMLFWCSRITLDVIGDVGFQYNFDALNKGHADPVAHACNAAVAACMEVDLFQAITIILSENKGFGWLRNLPTKANKTRDASRAVIDAEAARIVKKGKAEVKAEMAQLGAFDKSAFDEGAVSGLGSGKSIFNRMIRANVATDVKDSERLSDHELEQQLITLILAGHETSATGLSWACDLLSRHPEAQEKLRQELREAPREDADDEDEHANGNTTAENGLVTSNRGTLRFKDIHEVPYLDACMREIIRLAPSIPSTVRQAKEDAIIPLSKPYPKAGEAGKKGETFDSVFIPKGAEIFIPIQVIGASPEIWGDDALEFKPERWLNVPQSAIDTQLPGQSFAFLTGPRSCIGQRMALAEMKLLLAHIVLNFKLEPVPGYEFDVRQTIVQRAFVKGQEQYGTRMPLIVTPL
ncbi:hypothetical protein OC846_004391 [Tilletia horrida]|uniref:Cytochrome P450 n=1 Tax=Tilletia horrida TaxID=155126 RepID=A0AAN6GNR7_9BASI|nr:hypothetical protein OC845_006050 [Tilletia horrida]KAK0548703.1 hypothetical protein OC846_004391 [Tilletia horrida]KAK0566942.1 hypothetical protein OC861_002985 [Tilletia horrida]